MTATEGFYVALGVVLDGPVPHDDTPDGFVVRMHETYGCSSRAAADAVRWAFGDPTVAEALIRGRLLCERSHRLGRGRAGQGRVGIHAGASSVGAGGRIQA